MIGIAPYRMIIPKFCTPELWAVAGDLVVRREHDRRGKWHAWIRFSSR
jgi:hypothetical protein